MNEPNLREILTELGVEMIATNSSGWIVCRCPLASLGFHAKNYDREPSFFVHINNKGPSGYNCYACKSKGNIPSLIQKVLHFSGLPMGNLAHRARMKEIAVDFGEFGKWDESEEPPEPLNESQFEGVYPPAWEQPPAREYLEGREVTEEAAETMGLLYDPEGMRVMFPIRDYQHRLFGFSGRSILPDDERRMAKVKDYAGLKKTWHLLGENLIAESDKAIESAAQYSGKATKPRPLLVVEGLFAYARMISIGALDWITPVATLGSFLSVHQKDALASFNRPVYFLYDDDLAGDIGLYGKLNKATREHEGGGAIDQLKKHVPVYVCSYPEEGEADPDKLTRDDLYWILRHGSHLQF